PGEIDGIADARVHAEAAGRHEEMARIASKEAARGAVAFRDKLTRQPLLRREELDLEVGADGAADKIERVFAVARFARGEIAIEHPFIAAIDRIDDAAASRGQHPVHDAGIASEPRRQLGRAKIKPGGGAERAAPREGDAEPRAYSAVGAIAADEVIGGD